MAKTCHHPYCSTPPCYVWNSMSLMLHGGICALKYLKGCTYSSMACVALGVILTINTSSETSLGLLHGSSFAHRTYHRFIHIKDHRRSLWAGTFRVCMVPYILQLFIFPGGVRVPHLIYVEHASWTGSVLYRSCTSYHSDGLRSR